MHVENFLFQNCSILSVLSIFKYITRAKQTINLLLLDHFCPVISCRRVRKESDELLCTDSVTRYGPQSVASATWLTSFTVMARHARREFFVPKTVISSVSSIF